MKRHSEVVWVWKGKRWAEKKGKIEGNHEPEALGAGQQFQEEGDGLLQDLRARAGDEIKAPADGGGGCGSISLHRGRDGGETVVEGDEDRLPGDPADGDGGAFGKKTGGGLAIG